MIDVGKIPTFTGNLETLETHAAALKTTASGIRGTGKDVHSAFQALDAVYDAPEQEELLDSTKPVRDKADAFATKLESVSGALTSFATSARPLVAKMKQLRVDAEKFVADNKDDEDWQQDQGKIDENARLVREVGVTWVAFQGVERDAANKITTLVGGTHFVVDDGSHKAGMYGFKESDVKDAKETPWGTADEREYTGLRAAWEWTKDNVGSGLKGFFVDGVWGTLKGLGNMVNVFDLDTLKETWSGIGDVFQGVSGYLLTPWDWAMDKMLGPEDHSVREKNKAALRNFGKSLVAWDEWGKDPARAGGTVLFNVLTIGSGSLLKLGRAGKLGVGAEVATAMGKAGALVDPMSYLGKAANVTKIKVGDFMEGLKASRAGVDDMARNMPGGTSPHPAGYEYADPQGNKRVVGHDGTIRDEHGNVVPDTEPVREPHKDDLPNTHEPAPARERILEGAGGPSRAENSTGHPTTPTHPTGGSHTPGGHAGESPRAQVPLHGNGHDSSSGGGSGTPQTGAGGGRGTTGSGSHQHGGPGTGQGGDGSSGGGVHGTGQHNPAGHGSGSGHAGGPHDSGGHGDSAHDPADPGTGQAGTESGPGHTGDTATPQQDPPTVEELPPLPKGGRIPEHTFEHVLQGELKYDRNGNPKVSGYHFRPGGRDLNPYMVKVPRIIEIDHRTGLTTGNVWMRDPRTGEMVMKRAKTTFFPPGWTEKQVRRAMEKSFENGRVVDAATNKWRGDWKGITFEGYFDPITGDAKTIYPLMPK
ncbi:EndoU domain-containing protein [Streptomyces yangpuensis]|uniref:EndoU domain-containing protein n=1 Tax=Streptomyces yangpuensis TaxID=1648182 RepID=UPI003669458C